VAIVDIEQVEELVTGRDLFEVFHGAARDRERGEDGGTTRLPWRTFKVWDGTEGGDTSIEEGRGTTLDDAIGHALGVVKLAAEDGRPGMRLLLEGDVLVAVVRQEPGEEARVVRLDD
jgi:hypothetical protein